MTVFPMRSRTGELWAAGKINRRRPSEGQLAEIFSERHRGQIRFLVRKKRWIVWCGDCWDFDDRNLALHLARLICQEASEACGDPAIDSHRSAAGVVALAKCDPRLVAADWPEDPDLEAAVEEWIDDHCELDPAAWTARADLLASFPQWSLWSGDAVGRAWARRGIAYRRKGNVHGFDGVKLRETDDD